MCFRISQWMTRSGSNHLLGNFAVIHARVLRLVAKPQDEFAYYSLDLHELRLVLAGLSARMWFPAHAE